MWVLTQEGMKFYHEIIFDLKDNLLLHVLADTCHIYRSMFSASMTDAGTTGLQSSTSDEVGPVTAAAKSQPPPEPQGNVHECMCT